MAGKRVALIVANDEYDDPGLKRLEAPQHDADALAEVLGDPGVGAFDVTVLHNESAQSIRTAVEDFFVDRKPDDLLLLHFSCHGVKNADGELFLAAKDTMPNRLASTGLPADFVNRMMTSSRSQRIALFLDCCYGGAFPRGMLVRATGEAQVKDAFVQQEEIGGGRGRVVVTASNAMQYSFEAGELSEESVRPSVFTGALVDALSTGEADRDADGWIGMNELFSFVSDKVKEISPNQTPQMWTFGAQGDMFVARSRIRRVKPTPLEPALAEAMANPLPAARYGLVDLFRERLSGDDLGVALAAHQALSSMIGDDSRRLADSASAALESGALSVNPRELDLFADEEGMATGVLVLHGPPLATTITAKSDDKWIRIEHDDPRLRIIATAPAQPGSTFGTVRLTSPVAEHEVRVRITRTDVGEAPPPVAASVTAPVATAPAPEPVGAAKAVQTATPKPKEPKPPKPPREPREPREPRDPGNRRPLIIGGAAAAVVALVLGFVLTRGGNDDEKKTNTKADDTTSKGETKPLGALPVGPALDAGTVLWTDQSGGGAVVKYALPGEEVQTLANPSGQGMVWPVASPDGRSVFYQTVNPDNFRDVTSTSIRVMGTDGSGDRAVLDDKNFCINPGRPAIGPDNLIALACYDQDGERTDGLRVVDTDGKLVRVLDEDASVGGPSFTPDGKYLLYWRYNDVDFGGDPGQELCVVPVDGSGEPEVLTDDQTRDLAPKVSPDGTKLVFGRVASVGGENELYLADISQSDGTLTLSEPVLMKASETGSENVDPVWVSNDRIVYSVQGALMTADATPDAFAEPVYPDGDVQNAFKLSVVGR